MAFDFSRAITQARQAVHTALSLPATYLAPDAVSPKQVRVRWWQTKVVRNGDLVTGGWAEELVAVNQIVFNQPNLDEMGVFLQRGGRVMISYPNGENVDLILDTMDPNSGPIERVWSVVQA